MFSKAESGIALYQGGFNCSQAVLTSFCWKYGLNRELGFRLACGFGGGLQSGEVCGAVSAAVMIIGLKYGNALAADKLSKKHCYGKTGEFIAAFKASHGSILCRDLRGPAPALKSGSPALTSGFVCSVLVADAIRLLEEAGC